MAGQLSALTGLGSLRHLDLQLLCVDQVVRRDSKPRRGHLLDVRILRVTVRQRNEPLRILAALARVALGTDPIHRDRQRLVRLFADRAEGHGAGGKSLDDFFRRLDFVERNRLRQEFEVKQAAQV